MVASGDTGNISAVWLYQFYLRLLLEKVIRCFDTEGGHWRLMEVADLWWILGG